MNVGTPSLNAVNVRRRPRGERRGGMRYCDRATGRASHTVAVPDPKSPLSRSDEPAFIGQGSIWTSAGEWHAADGRRSMPP